MNTFVLSCFRSPVESGPGHLLAILTGGDTCQALGPSTAGAFGNNSYSSLWRYLPPEQLRRKIACGNPSNGGRHWPNMFPPKKNRACEPQARQQPGRSNEAVFRRSVVIETQFRLSSQIAVSFGFACTILNLLQK